MGAALEVALSIRDVAAYYAHAYFVYTSVAAAIVTASAFFFRSPLWRALMMGGGLGTWLGIALAPFFVVPRDSRDVIGILGWAIVALIGAAVAAARLEGRLPPARQLFIQLLIGGAIGGTIVVGLEVASMVLVMLTSRSGF